MPTPTPSRRSQLQEDTYFRVLRKLQDNPDLTQRDISQRLGVSTCGMTYCLNALQSETAQTSADQSPLIAAYADFQRHR
jgi:Trp operon repressor